MKVLPTKYRGVTYRSRAEARWAVVFDQVGWTYWYEPETFRLPCGNYLPDFYLPQVNAFFEVKGLAPTAFESRRAKQLCEGLETVVVVSCGPPNHTRELFDPDLKIFYPERFDDGVVALEYDGGFVNRQRAEQAACSIDLSNLVYLEGCNEIYWQDAFAAAANMRFGVYDA
jgi:hypothetical protein